MALDRRLESSRGRSMKHWQKDAARKSTSNIAAKGAAKTTQSSRLFAGLLRRRCLPSEEDDLEIAIAPLWLTETRYILSGLRGLFVCLFVCCSVCFCLCVCWVTFACCCIVEDVADGRAVPNAPDRCRPPRLRSTGPGQYLGGDGLGRPQRAASFCLLGRLTRRP